MGYANKKGPHRCEPFFKILRSFDFALTGSAQDDT